MTDITIPPEALEAGARAIEQSLKTARITLETEDGYKPEARAACLAMLKAWPGMEHDPGALVAETYRDPGKIILPLPQENTND